jgi:hypothetical protein
MLNPRESLLGQLLLRWRQPPAYQHASDPLHARQVCRPCGRTRGAPSRPSSTSSTAAPPHYRRERHGISGGRRWSRSWPRSPPSRQSGSPGGKAGTAGHRFDPLSSQPAGLFRYRVAGSDGWCWPRGRRAPEVNPRWRTGGHSDRLAGRSRSDCR